MKPAKKMLGKRVLVAEDEPEIRMAVYEILSEEGAEVVGVKNGTEALAMVLASRFDLVVSDIRMPGGDGPTLLKQMRLALPNPPPLLFISAYFDFSASEAARQGACGILRKPFGVTDLLQVVEKVLVETATEKAEA
ncbi:MAG: response regulator [Bacteriovoracia bacterium]